MTAVNSGILYNLRLNLPALNADLRASETAIQSHVAKMNQLKIVIPVTFAMPPGMPGGAGGMGAVNNVLNTSTFNTSNNTNNAVTNYFNSVTNTINNINNAANNAANAANKGRNSGMGGPGGLGRFGRLLGGYMMLREAEQVMRNEASYHESLEKAKSGTQIAEADIKHRTSYDSSFMGLGRVGRFIREAGESITDPGSASTESVERQIAQNERDEGMVAIMQHNADVSQEGKSELRIAQTPKGERRQLAQLKEARDKKVREASKYTEEEKKQADEIAARVEQVTNKRKQDEFIAGLESHDPNSLKMLQAEQDAEDELRPLREEQNRIARGARSRAKGVTSNEDAEIAAKEAEIAQEEADARSEANIKARRDRAILGGGNKEQADIYARRNEDAQKAEKYKRERPNEAAELTAADKAATDLAEKQGQLREQEQTARLALRQSTAQRELGGDFRGAKMDELTQGHRIAEAAEMDPAKRKQLEDANRAEEALAKDKDRKDYEKKEAESSDKVTEIRSKGHQAQLQEAGQAREAEIEGFDQSQQQVIAKINEEINAEQDADEKRRLIAQRDAQLDAQKVERMAFVAEQARKFAAEEEEAAIRLSRIKAESAASGLHAQGLMDQEGDAKFKASWDQREAEAKAAVDKESHAPKDANARMDSLAARLSATPGGYDSPEAVAIEKEMAAITAAQEGDAANPKLKQAKEAQAATAEARKQAEEARDADKARDNQQRQSEIGQTELRAKGQDYTARLKGITDKADKEYREAAAGPNATAKEKEQAAAKQALIRQQEKADLEEEQHEIRQKRARGEAVVGSRTDLTGKYSGADKMENLLKVNQNIEQILRTISGQLVPTAQ